MLIKYLKRGVKCSSSDSCDDFKLEITKSGSRTSATLIAKEEIDLVEAVDLLPIQINRKDLYFLNGYQSWTDTKEFKLSNRLRNIKKSPHLISHMFAMHAYGDNHFYHYSIRKSHGYDLFYSKGICESFIYNMNYDTAYLLIELIKNNRSTIRLTSDLKGLKLKAGDLVKIFDYYYFSNLKEGFESFYKDFSPLGKEKIFGYTSWYNYYQNINEEIILRDLKALDNRFNLFQIDDGYETFVGDWFDIDPKKFPNGLEPIVKEIHNRGFKAGIWLAPFVAEKKSKLFNEHKDWFAKRKGKPIVAGGNWSGQYALDLTNEEVKDYIRKCLKHYMDMGFEFFKLDFLYASNLPTYKGLTRAMQTSKYYQFLRDCLDQKMILGCGANMFNAYNLFDYMRIGPDVSLRFDDIWLMRHLHRERISTKVTLKNTVFRSIFNGHLFGNDPDVFLLRDENMWMSKENRHALITLNALFGSVFFTSDNLGNYDQDKKDELNYALDLLYNAKDVKYYLNKHFINVSYHLNNQEVKFSYDTKKGVILNGKK